MVSKNISKVGFLSYGLITTTTMGCFWSHLNFWYKGSRLCQSRLWARREAEYVIQQREKEGLPLIDENYYDPNKIVLPSAGEE
uniref:NADH dehydrogenase [ubiquinone] 1 beta subcomplex subunit 11, mitochondrial n=1 Tax=Lates calcarifer TaxID=8187 RepID=A0A4W6FU61_LATCA